MCVLPLVIFEQVHQHASDLSWLENCHLISMIIQVGDRQKYDTILLAALVIFYSYGYSSPLSDLQLAVRCVAGVTYSWTRILCSVESVLKQMVCKGISLACCIFAIPVIRF